MESEMRDIAPLLRRGWIYKAAVEEVAGRLHPDAQIRALHSRAVTAGKDYQRELDFVYADISKLENALPNFQDGYKAFVREKKLQ